MDSVNIQHSLQLVTSHIWWQFVNNFYSCRARYILFSQFRPSVHQMPVYCV